MSQRRVSLWSSGSLIAALLVASSPALPAVPIPASGDELQEALLSATVNGVADPTPLTLLRGAGNQIYATAEQLESWRLKADSLPSVTHQGEQYYLLNAIVGAKLEINENDQELQLTVTADTLGMTRITYAPETASDKVVSSTGAFVNYDINAQRSDSESLVGAALESVIFTPHGVGIASLVARKARQDSGIIRLDTNWTLDDPVRMRSFRLGDSIARGGVGGRPVRFAGLQFARNFTVQPGFITFPLPSFNGTANIPSVAEVYVNNNLAQSSDLPPGPFNIVDIPVVTGGGDVQIIVRDLLGRQQVISQPYYTSLSQLRRGLSDYSYEVGFLRRSFGQKSNDYGKLMLAGTHRYGFSDAFTGEAHIEATKKSQTAGIGGSLSVPRVGRIEASVAASRSDLGNGTWTSFTLERRTRNMSFGVHAELASKNYTTIASTDNRRPPASIIQAFAGIPLKSSAIGVSYIRRKARGEEADAHLATANWSLRLGRIGSLNLAAIKSFSGDKTTSAEALLIIPLGPRTSASASATLDRGKVLLGSSIQRNLPIGNGLGYQLSAATGETTRIEGKVALRTSHADYDAQIIRNNGQTGISLSAAGAVGLVGSEAFVSRRIDQSFAMVKVGDYKGVRVYADNQLVGRTGKSGSLIIPMLRPYDRNDIRIDAGDLPLDAEIATEERTVRPYNRSGVVVDFEAKPSLASLIKVLLEDGTALPTGSDIKLEGRTDEIVSGTNGEVYLTGLETGAIATALAEWATGTCQFTLKIAAQRANQTPQSVQCRAISK